MANGNKPKKTAPKPPQEAEGMRQVLDEARNRLLVMRGEGPEKNDSVVSFLARHDSVPRALVQDTAMSDGGVRAYLYLGTYGPTPFPGMRSLARRLGGIDGAVRKTDECFLKGWLAKVVVRDEDGTILGTTYALFPRRLSPHEMVTLGVGWPEFVVRLAQPTRGKNDKKAPLRRRALQLILEHPELFQGVIPISDSAFSDSEDGIEKKKKKKDSPPQSLSKKTGGEAAVKSESSTRSFETEYGFAWPSGLAAHIEETKAVEICRLHGLGTDQARRVMGELAAEALRGFRVGAKSALHHLARSAAGTGRRDLAHTSDGDRNLGPWR